MSENTSSWVINKDLLKCDGVKVFPKQACAKHDDRKRKGGMNRYECFLVKRLLHVCYVPLTTYVLHCLFQTAVMTRTPEPHTVLVRPGPKLTPMETPCSVFAQATVVENGSVIDMLLPMQHLLLVSVQNLLSDSNN